MKKKMFILALNIIIIGSIRSADLRVTANPCMRTGAQMITDSLHRRIILFGGGNSRLPWGQYFNDVWALDLDSEGWKLLNPTGTLPGPRFNHSVAYYRDRNKMILFGGGGDTHYNDLWTLDLTPGSEAWTRITTTGNPPPALSGATAIVDQVNDRLIVFGGEDGSGGKNDVWSLNCQTLIWQHLNPSGNLPPARYLHRAVYDPNQNKMYIFGGLNNSTYYNDVWALDLTSGNENWQQLFPSGDSPGERCGFFCDYSNEEKMIIGFGWKYSSEYTYYNDIWILHLNSLTWERIYPTTSAVEGRRGPCGAYDPNRRLIYIFGGDQYYDYYLDDTYVLSVDPIAISENDKYCKKILPYIKINPTPFRIPCHINIFVPYPGNINVNIIDASGRFVKSLIRGKSNSGNYIFEWDGKDDNGKKAAAGIYFINLETNNEIIVKKTVFIE